WFFGIDPVTGAAVRHEWDGKAERTGEQVMRLDQILGRLGLNDGDILEFGVDLNQNVYVIDIQKARESGTDPITSSRAGATGQGGGELVIWTGTSSDGSSAHFFEFSLSATSKDPALRPVVVAAERPDISLIGFLMNLAEKGKRVVGMIFRVYSPLCHLSLLLR